MAILENKAAFVIPSIANPKLIQKKSRDHLVRQINSNWFKITSADSGNVYDVNLGFNGGTCSCRWGQNRPDGDHRSGCAHVIAAINQRANQQGRHVSVWTKEEDAHRQHRPILKIGDGLILTSRLAEPWAA